MSTPMTWRKHLRSGKRHGIPLCCRWRFALSSEEQRKRGAARRGARFQDSVNVAGDFNVYVPCGIFHRKHVSHSTLEARDRAHEARDRAHEEQLVAAFSRGKALRLWLLDQLERDTQREDETHE